MPNKKTVNPWTVLATREIYENPWIRIVEHEVLTPGGHPGIYGVVHSQNLATGVVAIDEVGNVVLVGQYRFPLKAYSWELPEGGGKFDEEPLEAIQRELSEETGYLAHDWLHLQTLHLSNCLSDERAEIFLAWNLEEGMSHPDDNEDLQLKKVPFAKALDMAVSGDITDAMSVSALLKVHHLARTNALPKTVRKLILDTK